MHIFRIGREYRRIGIGYGLPFFSVECGLGVTYTPDALMEKMVGEGCDVGSWVVIKNGLSEVGCGVFVDGLKFCHCKVEIDEDGSHKDPLWLPKVDRWLVWWKEDNKFNYSALRPRQDLIIYEGDDIEGFIKYTEKLPCLKAITVKEPDKVWDLVKKYEIRVYRRENGNSE